MNKRQEQMENKINPYESKQNAIAWLVERGCKVIDESVDYHRMSITQKYIYRFMGGKELDVIKSVLGEISVIDFEEKRIEVFTAVNNKMEVEA